MKKFLKIVGETFAKPKRSLDVFSDCFPDVDAEATTRTLSHAGGIPVRYVGIHHPLEAAYYTETLLDLDDAERLELGLRARNSHADIVKERERIKNSTLVIVNNIAPRKGTESNGREFLCAITFSGQEIYGVPAETLTGLRNRIAALFVVPNSYFKPGEQFRSAWVAAAVRENPRHLRCLYQSETRSALRDAFNQGLHSPIPEQAHPLEIRFVDRFGNIRLRIGPPHDTLRLIDRYTESTPYVVVRVGEEQRCFRARYTRSLEETPDGELGLYKNPSDGYCPFLELNVKWVNGQQGVAQTSHDLLGNPPLGTPVEIVHVQSA